MKIFIETETFDKTLKPKIRQKMMEKEEEEEGKN